MVANDVRRAGGRGYVLKSEANQDLIHAIETIHGGGTFFGKPTLGAKFGILLQWLWML
jgi:hypothetical protein